MKWFLFFVVLLCMVSCTNRKQEAAVSIPGPKAQPRSINYNDTATFPYETERDSGYFRGSIAEKIYLLEEKQDTRLFRFLEKNLFKKEIILLGKETLSHSVLINQKKEIRTDTLRNASVTIISTYYFGTKESQSICINGRTIYNYLYRGIDSTRQDILYLNERSFRHFSFKGTEFYYLEASIMDCSGGSACLIRYQLLYDVTKKYLNIFSDFRVDNCLLFGDADHDDNLDFFEIENDGGYGITDTNQFEIKIWSNNRSGKFSVLEDAKGKPYFLRGNTGNNQYVGDSMNITDYYWPVKLNF